MQIIDIAAIFGAAGISTLAAVLWVAPRSFRTGAALRMSTDDKRHGISFLFENDELYHLSETAARLYHLVPGRDDWTATRERLINRFPTLPEHAVEISAGHSTISAREIEDAASLIVTRKDEFTRVLVSEDEAPVSTDSQPIKTLQRELENLRRASDTTPHAVWQVDPQGLVTWYNAAYRALYRNVHTSEPEPTRPVFDIDKDIDPTKGHQRVTTTLPDDVHKDWYDITAARVGDITIFHAMDVNAVVKSEVAQRNFVQTLAKTFAQLSIGLAIFDRNGQLALFNPALIDLTELPADFLSGRPTLLSFFDRIRENRRMPEPKNYNSWRQEIAEVIAAATDGRYQETWTLETGQTYRVKGRPHPDGAIAFLIEDISAEISLTRNFRAELELGQSLMDSFDEALAVFSSTGVLTFCNLSYRTLWGLDPDNSFADVTIIDSVKAWKELCSPGARWDALTDFVLDFGQKTSWEMPAELLSGEPLNCTVSRIASGATIVRFEKTAQTADPAPKPLPDARPE